jgi:hypothetical protein
VGTAALGYEFAQESLRGLATSVAPPMGDAGEMIDTIVAKLAKVHAVDEGTGDLLDPVLDAWVDEWHNDIDSKYSAWESVLQLRELEALADVKRYTGYIHWKEQELADLDRQLRALRGEAEPAPATPSADPDGPTIFDRAMTDDSTHGVDE